MEFSTGRSMTWLIIQRFKVKLEFGAFPVFVEEGNLENFKAKLSHRAQLSTLNSHKNASQRVKGAVIIFFESFSCAHYKFTLMLTVVKNILANPFRVTS